jgi:hypothetical protein
MSNIKKYKNKNRSIMNIDEQDKQDKNTSVGLKPGISEEHSLPPK